MWTGIPGVQFSKSNKWRSAVSLYVPRLLQIADEIRRSTSHSDNISGQNLRVCL